MSTLSGGVIPMLGALVDGYKTTKGGLTFPPDAPLPKKVVSTLVRARLAEIGENELRPPASCASRLWPSQELVEYGG